MYKVFIELAQNVSYYSARQEKCDEAQFNGVGTLVIREWDDCFTLTTENPIMPDHKQKLELHCEGINRVDRESLRQMKRDTRGRENERDQGAHIGLMQIGLLSDNPLKYSFINTSEDLPSFSLTATINKFGKN